VKVCKALQEAISFNLKKQNRRASVLKFFLLVSVIFPIGLITYCLTQFCVIYVIIGSFIALGVLWILFRFYP
jgi:putative flippase GtrA